VGVLTQLMNYLAEVVPTL